MVGPRGIYIDGDYQGQDSYFDPNVREVCENPPHFFPTKTVAERMALAEKRGPQGGWAEVAKRSIQSGWPGVEAPGGVIGKQLRRDQALRLLSEELP